MQRRASQAWRVVFALMLAACIASPARSQTPEASARSMAPLSVVGVAPLPGLGVDRDSLPYTVQTGSGSDLADGANGSLAEFLLRSMSGVNIADVQGSPFQRNLSYRGYSASSLIGGAQGISVFIDGVRFNAPFGDVVSWDLIPEAALRDVVLVGGANPVYGLNALGGALALTTRSGLDSPGFSADLRLGSFARKRADLAWGGHDDNGNHAFVAGTYFDEDGWRDHSPGRLGNIFAKLGHATRDDEIEAQLLWGTSRLTGNGLVPDTDYGDAGAAPALARDSRSAVYTWPDLTRNRVWQGSLRGRHYFSSDLVLDALAWGRYGKRDTVNGDVAEDYEEYVDQCSAGFDEAGAPRSPDCPVTRDEGGAIPAAVLNTTRTRERSWGFALALSGASPAAASTSATASASGSTPASGVPRSSHRWSAGLDYSHASVSYSQYQQEGMFDAERGVTASPDAPVEFFSGVDGGTRAWGLYGTDTWQLLPRTFATASLRWNIARVDSELTVGDDPPQPRSTLDFRKLNPALGIVQQFDGGFALYANASQGNRVPTSIELGCADPASPCRLPAGLQSDPPLEQVVSRNYEVGARWRPRDATSMSLAVYRSDNRDDILFLRAPDTQQGYFANFAKTRNQGVDASLDTALGPVTLGLRYSFLDATYQADGVLASGERTLDVHPGMRIAGLPRHTLKLSADWTPVEAFTLGADLVAASHIGTLGNEDGYVQDPGGDDAAHIDAHVAGYAVLDLRAAWRIDRHFSLYGGVSNLFDTHYASFGSIGTNLFPGGALAAPQVAAGDAPASRFIAPGAPRAWFVGLRYRY